MACTGGTSLFGWFVQPVPARARQVKVLELWSLGSVSVPHSPVLSSQDV